MLLIFDIYAMFFRAPISIWLQINDKVPSTFPTDLWETNRPFGVEV